MTFYDFPMTFYDLPLYFVNHNISFNHFSKLFMNPVYYQLIFYVYSLQLMKVKTNQNTSNVSHFKSEKSLTF